MSYFIGFAFGVGATCYVCGWIINREKHEWCELFDEQTTYYDENIEEYKKLVHNYQLLTDALIEENSSLKCDGDEWKNN